MVTSMPGDTTDNWWIPTPNEDSTSLVVAALAVDNCDSAADFDCGADENYITDMYESFDMSMSDAANAEV